MTTIVLKDRIVEKIKTDPLLFGAVAQAIGVVPGSLIRLLLQNHPKLTQASVLNVIAKYLGAKDNNELLEIQ